MLELALSTLMPQVTDAASVLLFWYSKVLLLATSWLAAKGLGLAMQAHVLQGGNLNSHSLTCHSYISFTSLAPATDIKA